MIAHSIFPTLVCEFNYEHRDQLKSKVFERLPNHINEFGQSNELTANVDLHKDPALVDLFEFASTCAFSYLSALNIDKDLFDLNLVKTWMNIIKEGHTPIHNHADAHLCFVYYVNVPESYVKPINFIATPQPNELFHAMFLHNVTEYNSWNSTERYFEPHEGQMLVFPAKLFHRTSGYGSGTEIESPDISSFYDKRIAIAGDFLLTYSNKIGRSYGLMPATNWNTYSQKHK